MNRERGEGMRVSRKDFGWAVSEGVISEGQAEELWRALEGRNADRPRFDLPHVAYYFEALVVISDMTWFITLGWERFGGGGILATRSPTRSASRSPEVCSGETRA
jgi:hypothetical protein